MTTAERTAASSKDRQRLRREAFRLARETYDDEVSYERLIAIRDRLAAIDSLIYCRL